MANDREVTIKGWLADPEGDATALTVLVFVGGKNMATSSISNRSDLIEAAVAAGLHLSTQMKGTIDSMTRARAWYRHDRDGGSTAGIERAQMGKQLTRGTAPIGHDEDMSSERRGGALEPVVDRFSQAPERSSVLPGGVAVPVSHSGSQKSFRTALRAIIPGKRFSAFEFSGRPDSNDSTGNWHVEGNCRSCALGSQLIGRLTPPADQIISNLPRRPERIPNK